MFLSFWSDISRNVNQLSLQYFDNWAQHEKIVKCFFLTSMKVNQIGCSWYWIGSTLFNMGYVRMGCLDNIVRGRASNIQIYQIYGRWRIKYSEQNSDGNRASIWLPINFWNMKTHNIQKESYLGIIPGNPMFS